MSTHEFWLQISTFLVWLRNAALPEWFTYKELAICNFQVTQTCQINESLQILNITVFSHKNTVTAFRVYVHQKWRLYVQHFKCSAASSQHTQTLTNTWLLWITHSLTHRVLRYYAHMITMMKHTGFLIAEQAFILISADTSSGTCSVRWHEYRLYPAVRDTYCLVSAMNLQGTYSCL